MSHFIKFTLLLYFTPGIWTSNLESNNTSLCTGGCFYDSPEVCDSDEPQCIVSPTCSNAIVCCNLNDTNLREYLDPTRQGIDALHIQNSDFHIFNLNLINWLKMLKSIAITNGRMHTFDPPWTRYTEVKCLNLSSNGLTKMGKLSKIGKLQILDLSNNSLAEIPEFRANLSSSNMSITIDISDNKLLCDNLKRKLSQHKDKLNFVNANNTWCLMSANEEIWYNYSERLMLSELEKVTQLEHDCPLRNCTCILRRLDLSTQTDATVTLMVDCSNRGLQQLPVSLPENCIALNVSHNNISSLDIIHQSSYANLRELYADHNNITSIDALEGSKFIQNFVVLNLRNNNIKSIKIHSLKDAFDRATSKRELSLGQNFVECDCHAAKVLKGWLMLKDIRDIEEIYCSHRTDVKVIDLDPSELCRDKQSWTDYIFYIIVAEVLLLTFLIAKVTYDYWVFKSTGYLPWPASKMPKLPCDWLCE